MLKRYLPGLILTAFLALSQTVFALTIDKLVLFGDSLSDNGNLFSISSAAHKVIPLVPIVPKDPYYEGRFTNGIVWDEILAQSMHIDLANYAYGGAWVESTWDSGQLVPFDLNTQVNFYLVYASKDFDKEKHLYVLWAGANDYTQGRKDIDYATTNTISIIKKQIEWLAYYGAKNFLLATLPDLGRVPEVIEKGPEFSANVTRMIQLHNKKLADMVEEEKKKYPDLVFLTMDISDTFDDVLDHPDQYHLKNVSEGCYKGDYMFALKSVNYSELQAAKEKAKIDIMNNDSLRTAYMTSLAASMGVKPCDNPDEYFFWDHVHPTRVIHSIIAVMAQSFLTEHGVTGVQKG